MDQSASDNTPPLGQVSRRIARRLLTSGGNRIELFMVEVQEEREHLLHLLFLGVMSAVLGLMTLIALSGAVVVFLWSYGPLYVLLGLTLLYGFAAVFCYFRLVSVQSRWESFAASLDQLEKDRLCLEKSLA